MIATSRDDDLALLWSETERLGDARKRLTRLRMKGPLGDTVPADPMAGNGEQSRMREDRCAIGRASCGKSGDIRCGARSAAGQRPDKKQDRCVLFDGLTGARQSSIALSNP